MAFDSFPLHRGPRSLFPHMNMKWSPSKDKEHNHLYGTVKDIYGCYIEASCYRSLGMVGNPHHSNDAYKHGAHNLVPACIFSHKPNFDSKEPLSSSPHTYKPSSPSSGMSPHKTLCGTSPDTYASRSPTPSRTLTRSLAPPHHKQPPCTPSSHKDTSSSPAAGTLRTPPRGIPSHTCASHISISHYTPAHTENPSQSTP